MSGMAEGFQPYTLADAWRINNRVNLMLLDRLTVEQLAWAADPRARTIGDQFAHLHAVRLTWLEAGGRDARGIGKLAKGTSRSDLREALEASGNAVADWLADAEASGKMKAFRRGPAAFLAYLAAHEGHHRGQILLHLKTAKMAVEPEVAFGLWEWGKI